MKVVSPIYIFFPRVRSKDKKMALNINIYRNAHYLVNNLAKDIYRQAMEDQLAGLCFDSTIDLEFTLYKPSKRKIDRSNILCIVEKYFCDALVHYGCIGDDNDLWQLLDDCEIYLPGRKIIFGCCICKKPMPTTEAVIIIEETGQNFWIHKACVKEVLHEEFKKDIK